MSRATRQRTRYGSGSDMHQMRVDKVLHIPAYSILRLTLGKDRYNVYIVWPLRVYGYGNILVSRPRPIEQTRGWPETAYVYPLQHVLAVTGKKWVGKMAQR